MAATEPGLSEPISTPDWRDEIFAALKAADIRQIGYVPDAGHSHLIELCQADPEIRAIPLTSEEEGIGLAAGPWLGRPPPGPPPTPPSPPGPGMAPARGTKD